MNVSRLGMLFRTAEAAPPVATVIQLRMALSCDRRWEGAYVACTGRIVRAVRRPASGDALVATTIEESALRPAGCQDAPPVGSPYTEGASLLRALAEDDGPLQTESGMRTGTTQSPRKGY